MITNKLFKVFSALLALTAVFTSAYALDCMNYTYYQQMNFTAGSSISDYQWRVVLNSTNFNYSHSPSPLLLAIDSSGNSLPYWVQSWNTSGNSILWFKGNSSTGNFLCLGNKTAENTTSSASAVMEFFDNFSGSSMNASLWTEKGSGSTTVSGNSVALTGDHGWGTNQNFTGNYTLYFDANMANSGYAWIGLIQTADFVSGTWYYKFNSIGRHASQGSQVCGINGGDPIGAALSGATSGSRQSYELTWTSSWAYGKVVGGNTANLTSGLATAPLKIELEVGPSGSNTVYGPLFMTKYVQTTTSVSLGIEQQTSPSDFVIPQIITPAANSYFNTTAVYTNITATALNTTLKVNVTLNGTQVYYNAAFTNGSSANIDLSAYIPAGITTSYTITLYAESIQNSTVNSTVTRDFKFDARQPMEFNYYRVINSTSLNTSGAYNIVRLNSSNFNYSKVRANATDIRVFDSGGALLPCAIRFNSSGNSEIFFWTNDTQNFLVYGTKGFEYMQACIETPIFDDFSKGAVDTSLWNATVYHYTGGIYQNGPEPVVEISSGMLHVHSEVGSVSVGAAQETILTLVYKGLVDGKSVKIDVHNVTLYDTATGSPSLSANGAVFATAGTSGTDTSYIYGTLKVRESSGTTYVYVNDTLNYSGATSAHNITLIEHVSATSTVPASSALVDAYFSKIYEVGYKETNAEEERIMNGIVIFSPANNTLSNSTIDDVIVGYYLPVSSTGTVTISTGETGNISLVPNTLSTYTVLNQTDGSFNITVTDDGNASVYQTVEVNLYLYFIVSVSTPAYVSEGEHIVYNMSVAKLGSESISAYIYNSAYGEIALIQENYSQIALWDTGFYAPTVNTSQNLTFSNYIKIQRGNSTIYRYYANVTIVVNPFGLGACGATYTQLLYNISAYDEQNGSILSGNTFETQIIAMAPGGNTSRSYGFIDYNATLQQICMLPNTTIQINSTTFASHTDNVSSYSRRSYFVVNTLFSATPLQMHIYLLNSSVMSNVDIYTKDCLENVQAGRIVKFFKYYPALNDFIELFNVMTDNNGHAVVQVKAYDEWYKVVDIDSNNIVVMSEPSVQFSSASQNMIECNKNSYTDILNRVSYTYAYDNTTKIFSMTVHSSIARQMMLKIEQTGTYGNITYCTTSITGLTGVLFCDLSNMTATDFSWTLQTYETSLLGNFWMTQASGQYIEAQTSVFGVWGLFLTFMMLCVSAGAFLYDAKLGILASMITLTIARAMTLFMVSEEALLGLWFVAVVIIYVIRNN